MVLDEWEIKQAIVEYIGHRGVCGIEVSQLTISRDESTGKTHAVLSISGIATIHRIETYEES